MVSVRFSRGNMADEVLVTWRKVRWSIRRIRCFWPYFQLVNWNKRQRGELLCSS